MTVIGREIIDLDLVVLRKALVLLLPHFPSGRQKEENERHTERPKEYPCNSRCLERTLNRGREASCTPGNVKTVQKVHQLTQGSPLPLSQKQNDLSNENREEKHSCQKNQSISKTDPQIMFMSHSRGQKINMHEWR
jgi:hypothetical protein